MLNLLLEDTDLSLQKFIPASVSATLSVNMVGALEQMRSAIDSSYEEADEEAALFSRAGAAIALTLTAGFVSWLLRGGSLLATLLSTGSVWHGFDPIPVLAMDEDREEEDSEDEEYGESGEKEDKQESDDLP